jgi:hypothetical protein
MSLLYVSPLSSKNCKRFAARAFSRAASSALAFSIASRSARFRCSISSFSFFFQYAAACQRDWNRLADKVSLFKPSCCLHLLQPFLLGPELPSGSNMAAVPIASAVARQYHRACARSRPLSLTRCPCACKPARNSVRSTDCQESTRRDLLEESDLLRYLSRSKLSSAPP